MIPPGLTCARCTDPFARELARRTADGWVHAVRCRSAPELTGGRWVNVRGIARWITSLSSA